MNAGALPDRPLGVFAPRITSLQYNSLPENICLLMLKASFKPYLAFISLGYKELPSCLGSAKQASKKNSFACLYIYLAYKLPNLVVNGEDNTFSFSNF